MHRGKYVVMIGSKAETRVCVHTGCTLQHTHTACRHTPTRETSPAPAMPPSMDRGTSTSSCTRPCIPDSDVLAVTSSNTTGEEEL